MKYRKLGKTDLSVSELSFGTWAIGGAWGKVNDEESLKGLQVAMEAGVNFFDTADVYGDGHSEELLAKATKGKEDQIHIATKFCRMGDIHDPTTYSKEKVREYCEASLKRLKRDAIDLYQVHCPPFEIIKQGDVFEVLEDLIKEGKIKYYGVSVETVEEGLYVVNETKASAIQVIFNMLRQKPLEQLLPYASEKGVGILVRLPLASGLLTGKFTTQSTFEEDDHRKFNRNGEAFNVGETFGGLEFERGVKLSQDLAWIANDRVNMTRAALRWIIDQPEISCVIPGFRNVKQVQDNLGALNVPSYSAEELKKIQQFYKNEVHKYIRGVY
ncbi:aryl-alcohol dehydrogenase-like predicted oxidoreductase [Bacillus mesophilus]|uniref:Aldo/keto reductase n=1 Tax=Bacillus mesophilus TaxID=1808955 RepID=A0A6M0QBW1_9BACI|nr:aldo/keto reductase [Bacillus mesophilus]MBM7660123.1 aryl-alcohol dehydrogenase-like predicted oxidoreductase [Bacillus mesophilus]NEY73776.1 aldo/keto reductase [Bacillus mesophilus]